MFNHTKKCSQMNMFNMLTITYVQHIILTVWFTGYCTVITKIIYKCYQIYLKKLIDDFTIIYIYIKGDMLYNYEM